MAAAPRSSERPSLPCRKDITIRSYLIGVVLASALTAIPFGLVAARALSPIQTIVVIGVAAITQVIVHLRYFLHVDLKPSSQNKMAALGFAAVVLLVLVGGTLGIMLSRYYRMT
jgi:cytochrome o ubiquinol oxidase operon protein cyoD